MNIKFVSLLLTIISILFLSCERLSLSCTKKKTQSNEANIKIGQDTLSIDGYNVNIKNYIPKDAKILSKCVGNTDTKLDREIVITYRIKNKSKIIVLKKRNSKEKGQLWEKVFETESIGEHQGKIEIVDLNENFVPEILINWQVEAKNGEPSSKLLLEVYEYKKNTYKIINSLIVDTDDKKEIKQNDEDSFPIC